MPALIIAFSAPFSGFLADKAGRKPLLIFGLILYAFAGITGLYLSDLYILIAGRALLGIAVAAIMIASVTLAGDYFTGKARNQFLGFQASFMAAGGIVFLVSGGLLADIHWRWPFAMYAFSLVILLMVLFFIHEPAYLKEIQRQNTVARLPLNAILIISTIVFMGMLMFYFIPVQLPFLLTSVLNTGNAEVGFAIGIGTLASAISALIFKRFKDFAGFSSLMAVAFALMAIGFYFISKSETNITMLPSIFISGLGLGIFILTSNLWIMQTAPVELMGYCFGHHEYFPVFRAVFFPCCRFSRNRCI